MGEQSRLGSITASYATGNATGGGGNGDRVGALMGRQSNGSTTASYATGTADGGDGSGDYAGALVGQYIHQRFDHGQLRLWPSHG